MKKLIKKILVISLISIIFFSSSSHAEKKLSSEHVVLQDFEKAGGKVDFLGNSYGLDGWLVVNPEGRVQYVYTNKEGALVIGMMFAPDGEMETLNQIKAYKARAEGSQSAIPGAEKSTSKAEKIYAAIEKANWITIGDKSTPYIYVFLNTTCEHCHKLWNMLSGAVKNKQIHIRFIPFGFSDDNKDGGAALLSSNEPYKTWEDYIAGNKSVLDKKNATKLNYARIEANNKIAKELALPVVPFTAYRKVSDGSVTAIAGVPENPMLLLADLQKPAKVEKKKPAEEKK